MERKGRIFTVITDMDFRIPFKSGCDCFPGLIQLNSQLLHAFMSIGGMSQCTTDGNTLSLPLYSLISAVCSLRVESRSA